MNRDDADNRLPNQCSSVFVRVTFVFALVLFLLAACGRSPRPVEMTIVATPGLAPTPLPTRPGPTPTPSSTPTPSVTPAGWETIGDGVQIHQSVAFDDGRGGYVYALRLDPSRVDIQLRYDPDRPRTVAEWFAAERPLAALNAGFFSRRQTPVGRWVIDDVTFGRGHRRMQGEFLVSGAGVSIRRLSERDLNVGARIIASIESYPLLLLPGGIVNPCLAHATDRVERLFRSRPCVSLTQLAERLIVGIDGAGYVMFLLIPSETFTLRGLADWLKRSDLNLDVALNLDGGSSAGMLVQVGDRMWGQNSGREVPGAIIVRPKVLGINHSESPYLTGLRDLLGLVFSPH